MLADNARAAVRSPEIAIADLPGLAPSYPVPAVIAANPRRVFVERGLALRGAFDGCDHLAIAGRVESDIGLRILDVLEQGSFKGRANVGEARIFGRYEGALTVTDTLVVGPSGHISGPVQCGKLQLADGGKIDGALGVLAEEVEKAKAAERAAAAGPVDTMLASATAVEDGASLAEAEATFRAALETNLCDVAALSGLGHLARRRGDLAGALHYFEQVMAADAENVSVRCVIIDILRALSRHDEAAATEKEVLTLRSQPSPALSDEAAGGNRLPGFDEAEAMFKSVLDRHPKNLGALAGLGHLARRRGDRAAMHQYYAAALALEPMNITLRVEVPAPSRSRATSRSRGKSSRPC